jgi:hypothetical protein
MSKLVITGYAKLKSIRIGNWVCSVVTESDNLYTFLFDFSPEDYIEHQDFFNLVSINRNYTDTDGYHLQVDFNIVRHSGFVEEFKGVKQRYIYPHELVTLDKFKKLIEPLLVLSA